MNDSFLLPKKQSRQSARYAILRYKDANAFFITLWDYSTKTNQYLDSTLAGALLK